MIFGEDFDIESIVEATSVHEAINKTSLQLTVIVLKGERRQYYESTFSTYGEKEVVEDDMFKNYIITSRNGEYPYDECH